MKKAGRLFPLKKDGKLFPTFGKLFRKKQKAQSLPKAQPKVISRPDVLPEVHGDGDSHFQWYAKPTTISHAAAVSNEKKTLCGLKLGKQWFKVKGQGNPWYKAKCPRCRALVKQTLKAKEREKQNGNRRIEKKVA